MDRVPTATRAEPTARRTCCSGPGPARDERHHAVGSLFSESLVAEDLRLPLAGQRADQIGMHDDS